VTATSGRLSSTRLLCGGAAIVLAFGGPALAEIAGSPRIVDGRTLEVAGQKVRLFGIDAPDLDQVCRHGGRDYQCGKVARAALWDLVAGLDVSCTPEAEAPGPDGSIAASCTAGDRNLNESMVAAGWALADRDATERYVAIEADARKARRGLWKGEFEPPWQWRQANASGDSGNDAGASAR
jgi:endonuclease YncB( thermonuclease family)